MNFFFSVKCLPFQPASMCPVWPADMPRPLNPGLTTVSTVVKGCRGQRGDWSLIGSACFAVKATQANFTTFVTNPDQNWADRQNIELPTINDVSMIASILPANILAIAVPNSPRLRQISFFIICCYCCWTAWRALWEEISYLSSCTETAAPTCRYSGLIRDPADG